LQTISQQTPQRLTTLLGYARGLTNDQVISSFDTLTGETYASSARYELNGQGQFLDTVFHRLKLARDTGEQGAAVWAEPYTYSSSRDASNGIAETDYRIRGVIVGADTSVGSDLRLGAHASFANSRTQVDSRRDLVDIDQYAVGLHALYMPAEQWWVEGAASYGWQRASGDRSIQVGPLFDSRASSRYDGKSLNAGLEGGYRFNTGAWHLEPFIGAYYAKVKYDAFTEAGAGDANLNVGRSRASSMAYGAGLRVIGDFAKQANGTQIHPIFLLRYLHDTRADSDVSTSMAFAGAPDVGFTTRGTPGVSNHWQAGAGLSFDISPQASAYFYYTADIASRGDSHAANLGVRWSFAAPAAAMAASAHRMDALPAASLAPAAAAVPAATPAADDPSASSSSRSDKAAPIVAGAALGAAGAGAAMAGKPAGADDAPLGKCRPRAAAGAKKAAIAKSKHVGPRHVPAPGTGAKPTVVAKKKRVAPAKPKPAAAEPLCDG